VVDLRGLPQQAQMERSCSETRELLRGEKGRVFVPERWEGEPLEGRRELRVGILGAVAEESRAWVRRESWLREEAGAGLGIGGRAVSSDGPADDPVGGPGGASSSIPESVSSGSPSDLSGPAAHERRLFANRVSEDSRFFGGAVLSSPGGAIGAGAAS
jgi:hypothetical protein